MGKPTKYNGKQTIALVEALEPKVHTNDQIAAALGIGSSTIFDWRKKYPEFLECIKRHQKRGYEFIESKLFNRASGYDYQETKTSSVVDSKGKVTKQSVETTDKHKAADPGSAMFILKNKCGWKSEPEVKAGGDSTGPAKVIRSPLAGPPAKQEKPKKKGKKGGSTDGKPK